MTVGIMAGAVSHNPRDKIWHTLNGLKEIFLVWLVLVLGAYSYGWITIANTVQTENLSFPKILTNTTD